MKYVISHLLELVSHFLFLGIFAVAFFQTRLWRYGVMVGHYLITTTLLAKIILSGDQYNIHLYNVLFVFSGVAFSIYFLSLLGHPWKQTVSVCLGAMTLLYYIFNNFWFGREELFDSLGYAFISLSVMVMVFLYFHTLLTNVNDKLLSLNFDFWFICSQMIYHLGAFAIFLSYNYLTRRIIVGNQYSDDNRTILTYLWGVHNVLLFISALVTGLGLWWIYRHRNVKVT